MTNQDLNELATIATRFSQLNNTAKNAKNAIQDLRFELFSDFISTEDFEVLVKALRIVEEITAKSQQRDAINYFKKSVKL